MSEVWFYHLTETPLDMALIGLLPRALERGWRIELRGSGSERMEELDRALWLGPDDGFLPHGLAGGDHDASQPVLLTVAGQGAANGAACLMVVDNAPMSLDEIPRLERACVVFDGNAERELSHARALWRKIRDAGLGAQYWAQESGRWVKKQ